MKALSVKQPWAGNIAVGKKTAEIRSRRIKPQGEILICSALKPFEDIEKYQSNNAYLWGKWLVSKSMSELRSMTQYFGHAIAVVNWYDTMLFTKSLAEKACFDPEKWPYEFYENHVTLWAWMFKDARLIEPFPVKGKQGFFEVDEGLIRYL